MIHFTKHALEKFAILKRHGITIPKSSVAAAIINPETVDYSRRPLKIAQRSFDKTRVLRVVYKEMGDDKIVITFYPGRKKQYGKS